MSRAFLHYRLVGFSALLALICAFPSAAVADEVPSADAAVSNRDAALSPLIQYRRIYVPADKFDVWPRDGEKLIPIDSREFDALIHSVNEAATGQENRVALKTAEYSARLDTAGQLHGTGRWAIVLRGNKPAFVPLGHSSLIVHAPRWQSLPQRPARIGTWGGRDRTLGRFGLEVARTDTLEFDWHIETRSTDDEIEIPWRVPAANSARLTLDLPEGKQPRIEGGVVLESALRPSEDKSPGKQLRRWVIVLNPSRETSLQIASTNRKASEPTAQAVLCEEVDYRIGSRGLEVTAAWNLVVPPDQKRELRVAVPPGLQLSSIKADSGDLSWRFIRDSSTPTDTALVELPKSEITKPLQITFNAWQPLIADTPWRLPRLRPEGVYWSSGKFTLSVAATHELKHLNLTDCVETSTGRINTTEESPETHSFAAYSSSAGLELTLSERQVDTTIHAGSSLALADPNLNGRLVTQLKLTHGATHRFVGRVAPGWIVEALEAIPSDAMTEWFIDRQGNEQQIEIQLSRAASAAHNLTIIVTARLQRFNLTERLSAETMRMVHWNGAKTAQHLLTFQSNEPYAVVPIGKLSEVAADTIDANDRSLLDASADNKVYDLTDPGTNAGLQFALRRGQFSAHIGLEATSEKESLRCEYRIAAEPSSGPIDRILVYAADPLGDSTRWFDKATNIPIATEKLAPNDPQRAGLPKEGEAWMLRLPQPASRPFELIATVNTKRAERAHVPLLFLPEATQQEAKILLRCRNQSALWLEPTHLQTVPLPPNDISSDEPNSLPPVCAAYRYQPADCRDPALAPKLWTSAISESKTIPLIARHIELESYFWPDGSGAHRATYQLDNHGAAEIRLDLPTGMILASASLDGQALDIAKPSNSSQPALIRLLAQARATKLSLYLETGGPSLTAGHELTPPSILRELPFVGGDWTIWLPEEYSATGTGLSAAAPDLNWRERLFGVLGRPSNSRPFNPFRFADSGALVNGLVDPNVSGSSNIRTEDRSPKQDLDQNKTIVTEPAASMAPARNGWRSYHETFIATGPAPVVVLHPPAITAWAVALLLAYFLCGHWIRRMSPEAFAVALAAAAGSGLVLPVTHAYLASGAVLGLLLSLIAEWPRRSISGEESVHRARRSSATTVALVAVTAISIAKFSHAESLPAEKAVGDVFPNKIYRLLIPTDEHGHPAGAKYYVSDEFLRKLIAAAADSTLSLGQWILNDATFTGELTENQGQKSVVAGNWKMTFAIETLARETTVVLPLLQKESDWNATAMLDGVPLPLDWGKAGSGCAIQVPEPGHYSLTLSCVPKTRTTDDYNQIELTVPPIPGAKIEVRYPETAAAVKVANAAILTPLSGSANTLYGEINQINKLDVRWSLTNKPENGAPGFSIAELRWIHITPTELEISVKYILEGGARRPDSIAVAYDNRWNLLTTEKSLNAKIIAGGTGQQVIRIPISNKSTDRQEVSLRWRLVDAPAFGNLRLPPIELNSHSPSKRWFAISSDSAIDCEIADVSATESTANEFFAKWGEADANDLPQSVVSNFDSRRATNLVIRPRETESIVDELLNVSASLKTLHVNYEARTTPGMPDTYQAELSVPADLSINEIGVTEGDRQVPLRWSQTAKNRVTVFFSQQVTKPYRFVLDGTMPVNANGKASLPRISTLATEDVTQKVRIYRGDDVQIEFEGPTSSSDPKTDAPGSPPSQWTARPVATRYLESGSAAPTIIVKPNTSKIAGDSLTSLTRENGIWSMNYRCQLSVEDGALDILRLRIPNTVTGPFDVQSASPVATAFKPADEHSGTLSIRFATSVTKGGTVDLRIRSPLKMPSGTAVSSPAIAIESLVSGRRYISVPDSIESQTAYWTETGVRRATVPPKLRTGFTSAPSAVSLEVVTDPFQVASRPSIAAELSPQIRLADTVIVADDLGAQRIATHLIVAPHGLSECMLQLPPKQSLVAVELDGRPAVMRQLDQSQWQVALGAAQLPQSLEIVSRSSANDTRAGATELLRPALLARGKPIPAEISLWSFAHPRESTSHVVAGANQVTAIDQSALRFDRLVSIAEAAKSTAAELPSPDGYNWFQPWAKLLNTARNRTQQAKSVPERERPESQVSHAVEEQINQAAARLDKWLDDCRGSLVGPNSAAGLISGEIGNSPGSTKPTAPATNEWTFYVAEGGNDRLTLHLQRNGPTSSQIRFVGLLLITSGLIAAIWLIRRPAAIDALCRWPHACGVLIGIATWAWMWPSWLGILIAGASLWLALRSNWPGRSLRTEASTVLRASRTA